VKWVVTIIPIWFVGMTLYQRIFACREEKTAKRAWYIAGLFEWPVMAFMGVILGLFARVAFETGMFAELGVDNALPVDSVEGFDREKGLPMLLRTVLPVGLMGLMMSAYFSAIMSTADSCLMAASGNLLTDIFGKYFFKDPGKKKVLRISQILTLIIGTLAILLASSMENVLDLMLYSYAFMVSGLFVPVIAAFIIKKPQPLAAIIAMVLGGSTTVVLTTADIALPFGLDPNIFGIAASAVSFMIVHFALAKQQNL
jgi:SSS family solute:Na+ symporter